MSANIIKSYKIKQLKIMEIAVEVTNQEQIEALKTYLRTTRTINYDKVLSMRSTGTEVCIKVDKDLKNITWGDKKYFTDQPERYKVITFKEFENTYINKDSHKYGAYTSSTNKHITYLVKFKIDSFQLIAYIRQGRGEEDSYRNSGVIDQNDNKWSHRLLTEEERTWLDACIAAGKLVDKPTNTEKQLEPKSTETALQKAIRLYPKGTRFKMYDDIVESDGQLGWFDGKRVIATANGAEYTVYHNGKWAEIIPNEEVKEQPKPSWKVGDWVTVTSWDWDKSIKLPQTAKLETISNDGIGNVKSYGLYVERYTGRNIWYFKEGEFRKATQTEIDNITGVETEGTKAPTFKIGDRVRVLEDTLDGFYVGAEGILVEIDTYNTKIPYLVAIDKDTRHWIKRVEHVSVKPPESNSHKTAYSAEYVDTLLKFKWMSNTPIEPIPAIARLKKDKRIVLHSDMYAEHQRPVIRTQGREKRKLISY